MKSKEEKHMRKKSFICLLVSCLLATTMLLGGCSKSKSKTSGGFNVIVLGQVGHGKSEVTSSIASAYDQKISVDQLNDAKECKSGSVTYHAQCVSIQSESRKYNIYDLPDYSDIGKSIASQGIVPDGAILVINANDGIMIQTREHIEMIKGLGIGNVVVYISNCTDSMSVEHLMTDVKEYYFENVEFITDYDNYSKENMKKVVSVMDTWKEDSNKARSVSGTTVGVFAYDLSTEDGGKHTPIMTTDELEITINSKTYTGRLATPDVDMLMPGDMGREVFELDEKASAKAGDKVTVKKDGEKVIVGVVIEYA